MKLRVLTILTTLFSISPMVCKADTYPLGVASAYNAVALGYGSTAGTITDNVDVTGRMAAAGLITSGSDDIGSALASNDPYGSAANGYTVVAGGGISGSVTIEGNGSVYALGATPGQAVFHGSGQLVNSGSSPIDFNALRSQLDNESTTLALLTANGKVCESSCSGVSDPNYVVLTGTSTGPNVFRVSASDLTSHQIDIIVPPGSTVLINVDGTSDNLAKSFLINGDQSGDTSKVLVNFSDATTVTDSSEFNASILAPFATFSGDSVVKGTLIAAAIGNTGEIENNEFTGSLPGTPTTPAVPEPGTLALVGTGVLSITGAVRRRKASQLT